MTPSKSSWPVGPWRPLSKRDISYRTASMPKTDKFEVSLEKLEKIVEKLESGELSLEDSLKQFEEGMRLSKFCEERLNEAKKKIEILMKDGKRQKFELEEGE